MEIKSLTAEDNVLPQGKQAEALATEGKVCERCGNAISYETRTDYSAEGDGLTAEVEIGHSEDCSLLNN